MLLQLNPPLPMDTPKGGGLAYFVIDYGPEADLQWVVFLDEDGACWTVRNTEVRMQANWTMGRARSEAERTCAERAAAQSSQAATPFRPSLASGGEPP
jgi:hypothetical protein